MKIGARVSRAYFHGLNDGGRTPPEFGGIPIGGLPIGGLIIAPGGVGGRIIGGRGCMEGPGGGIIGGIPG
ncbi:MAG: hypothetical protein IKC70_01355 [Bacteroidaceae bacterium]|nr:hypothetical protein [Bacteroidaceae bacterium]